MKKQQLIIEQLDKKIIEFYKLREIQIPSEGWILSIRKALKMSLRQLGKRMNITAQSVKEIESREKNGTVSINVLKQVGKALNMKFIYGYIPKSKTLDKMIEEKANKLAEEIVLRTSTHMMLEDQENAPERIKKSIKEKSKEIKEEIPRYLWD
jgi:predicted DNA-binding mobile mystery protein A